MNTNLKHHFASLFSHHEKIPSAVLVDLVRLMVWLGGAYYEGLKVFSKKTLIFFQTAADFIGRFLRVIGHTAAIIIKDFSSESSSRVRAHARQSSEAVVHLGSKTGNAFRDARGSMAQRVLNFFGIFATAFSVGIDFLLLFFSVMGRISTGIVEIPARMGRAVRDPRIILALPDYWRAMIGVFVVGAIFCVLPFPAVYAYQYAKKVEKRAITHAITGINHFQTAYGQLGNKDIAASRELFNEAEKDFLRAQEEVGSINPLLLTIAAHLPGRGERVIAGQRVLEAGKELSATGKEAVELVSYVQSDAAFAEGPLSLITRFTHDISLLEGKLTRVELLLNKETLAQLPRKYGDTLRDSLVNLHQVNEYLRALKDLGEPLRAIMGEQGLQRYLVVFQNNAELRPTGGFMGSFALVDVDKGAIKKVEIPGGGPYELRGLLRAKVIAPQPLSLINPTWQFQDANWFADFPTSARKMEWFYAQSGGASVDGVMALNAPIIESLLEITGPIAMSDYGKVVTSENILTEMQKAVELEYDRTKNKPKQFVSDLFPKVMEALGKVNKDKVFTMLSVMVRAGLERDVQMYFNDETLQKTVASLGLDGALRTTRGDYSMIVDTNIGGAKSDQVIDSSVHHSVRILDNHDIEVTITLERVHHGKKSDPFTGITNVDFLRFYAPQGSALISAQGFNPPEKTLFKNPPAEYGEDIDLASVQGAVAWDDRGMFVNSELDKTVFSNWSQLAPGQRVTHTLSYRVPFSLESFKNEENGKVTYKYPLLIQQQSGVRRRAYTLEVVTPMNKRITGVYPKIGDTIDPHSWQFELRELRSDQVVGLTVE